MLWAMVREYPTWTPPAREGNVHRPATRRGRCFGWTPWAALAKAGSMSRIAIVGPGAVGGVMAAWLSKTGRHEVILCARRPLGELHVETPNGLLVARPVVLTAPEQAGPVDWVLVATKAYDAAGAAAWLAGLAAKGAPVAILQNGVEHRERFAAYLPAAQLVPVMVDCPAERSSPTSIRQRGTAKMAVQDDAPGREFAALFAGTPVEVALTTDLKSAFS